LVGGASAEKVGDVTRRERRGEREQNEHDEPNSGKLGKHGVGRPRYKISTKRKPNENQTNRTMAVSVNELETTFILLT
jgi:hypothetical protein